MMSLQRRPPLLPPKHAHISTSEGRPVDSRPPSLLGSIRHRQEGLVAIAYERRHGPDSRVHWAAKNYLFAGSSGLFNCPLAMTDGAARVAEVSEVRMHGHATLDYTPSPP